MEERSIGIARAGSQESRSAAPRNTPSALSASTPAAPLSSRRRSAAPGRSPQSARVAVSTSEGGFASGTQVQTSGRPASRPVSIEARVVRGERASLAEMFEVVPDPRPAFREPGEEGFMVRLVGDSEAEEEEVHAVPIKLARQYSAPGLRTPVVPDAWLEFVTPDMVTFCLLSRPPREGEGGPRESCGFVRLLGDDQTQQAFTAEQMRRIARTVDPASLLLTWGDHTYNLAEPTAKSRCEPKSKKRAPQHKIQQTTEAWLASLLADAAERGLAAQGVRADAHEWELLSAAAAFLEARVTGRLAAAGRWELTARAEASRRGVRLAIAGVGDDRRAALRSLYGG